MKSMRLVSVAVALVTLTAISLFAFGVGLSFSSEKTGTYEEFFTSVIHEIAERSPHVEITDDLDVEERASWLVGWAMAEEPAGHGAANNPLNTTRDYGENTYFNHLDGLATGIGVRNYSTWREGVLATTFTLIVEETGEPRGGHKYGYDHIVAVLFNPDASFQMFRLAVNHSSWCPNCNRGHYAPYQPSQAYADTQVPTFSK